MSTSKRGRFTSGTLVRALAAVAICATTLVWIDSSGHVEAADLIVSTPYPSVVAQPGSVVKFDLSVTAPAVSVAQLSVDQLPSGWTTTLRGGHRIDHEAPAAQRCRPP